jgi:branched-chain amino acid transport system ATP-binding protein
VIEVEGLTVTYGAVQALRDATFTAATGKITAVLGANGAGKTTLLRTISGLVGPAAGSIRLDGLQLIGMAPEMIARRGRVAHVPEGRGVIEEFTVEENLRLGALHAKVNVTEGLKEQYEQFPVLGERRRQHAGKLSGGERQMLALARALISNPQVLLLDEPSLGLAPIVTEELMKTIRELCGSRNLTVLLVEQNATSALKISADAVVLHVGSIVAAGPSAQIAADERLKQYYLGMAEP